MLVSPITFVNCAENQMKHILNQSIEFRKNIRGNFAKIFVIFVNFFASKFSRNVNTNIFISTLAKSFKVIKRCDEA
jgi:hypothetical protein